MVRPEGMDKASAERAGQNHAPVESVQHFPDALRYFATSRPLPAERPVVREYDEDYVDFDVQVSSLFEEF